jgi:two-component system, response regulator PdtaR
MSDTITYQALDAPIVLLVEDEVLIRMAMADALRDEGFAVIEAAYPKEAITAVNGGMRPDVLFTDIRMPGDMDGVALAGALQDRLPHLRVFIASGHEKGMSEARRLQNFIVKPYEPSEVAKRIKLEFEGADVL